jgi:hypothetical protein
MSNGLSSSKVGSSTKIQQPPPTDLPKETPKSEAAQPNQQKALTETGKVKMKTLHQMDGAAKEASLRSAVKPNPLADPTRDARQTVARDIVKDGKLSAKEAQDMVNLAKDDAKLPVNEKNPKNLEPALTNLYVRSGVPLDEAQRLAGRTVQLAKDGKGEESFSLAGNGKTRIGPEQADKIRAAAEDDTKTNAAANKKWSVDEIKQDKAGFLRHAVQMDGDRGTSSDFKACAPTSFMGGIILSKPEAAQDLAKKLNSDAGKKEFPEMQKEPVKGAVDRMASGNFSPKDVSVVSNGLYASARYQTDKGLSEGVPVPNQMALIGRMQKIGFTPPKMKQETYGTNDRQGTHVTAFANNTGYDPWPYPGSNGQSTLIDGPVASRNQGLAMGPRLGASEQKRVVLETMQQDGKGGIILERHTVDKQPVNPPLKACYTFNAQKNGWERDPKVDVPKGHEKNLPDFIPVEHDKRKDLKMEQE